MQTELTTQPAVQPAGCCPPFDPAPWQNQEITWHGKPFVKDHVTCLFHVPLNMGRVVVKDMALIDAAGAAPDHPLMLSETRAVVFRLHDLPEMRQGVRQELRRAVRQGRGRGAGATGLTM